MNRRSVLPPLALCLLTMILLPTPVPAQTETPAEHTARMQWWREARFGLFIHWGLYAIPAGEWEGQTNHAEWIRTTAQIPLEVYDKFVQQFTPVRFNADEWVRLAKDAGMKYIVITSKHHDGFGLFDSRFTEFDVMSTPFKRDILKELAEACRKQGMKICWYHSIMDWHHPDYLPRREWEKTRSTEGANYDRYVQYMKNQIRELLTNYGDIGVLWFDGEWESTWNTRYGQALYDYVRSLQPAIIINNRVGASRAGMEGLTKAGEFGGDFGTPEQQIPATGLPGVDWETCMTMNDHWGFNKHDQNWKSSEELIRMLADIASKGGNFLLNVGPTAEGVFPEPSIDRLREIGKWMKVNGEAIHGTQASPFASLPWGRCTRKALGGGTRLFLHVFDWPVNGELLVQGLANKPIQSYLLADAGRAPLRVDRVEDAIRIGLPRMQPDPYNSVVVLDVAGDVNVIHPPALDSDFRVFVDTLTVNITANLPRLEVRYTLDGSTPTARSPLASGPITITETTTLCARSFLDNKPVSGATQATYTRVAPRLGHESGTEKPGIQYRYFEGEWDALPDFSKLQAASEGTLPNFQLTPRRRDERIGFEFSGFIRIEQNDVYAFFLNSDDGSHLYIDDSLVVDNDGLHAMLERRGDIPLGKGLHPFRVIFFEKTGDDGLEVSVMSQRMKKQHVADSMLFRSP